MSLCSQYRTLLARLTSSNLARSISYTSSSCTAEVGITSGAPPETYERKVIIYAPARTAAQQGLAKTVDAASKGPSWKIEFESREKWENPLIGWTSTADPLEHVGRSAMAFGTQEDAERFCRRHGWAFEVREPHVRRTVRAKRYAGYGDNFSVKRGGYPEGGLTSELAGKSKPAKK